MTVQAWMGHASIATKAPPRPVGRLSASVQPAALGSSWSSALRIGSTQGAHGSGRGASRWWDDP